MTEVVWKLVEDNSYEANVTGNGFPETLGVWKEDDGYWRFSQGRDSDGIGLDTFDYLFNNEDDAKEWAEIHYYVAGTDNDNFDERYKTQYVLR